MKLNTWKKCMLFLVTVFGWANINIAQISSDSLKLFIANNKQINNQTFKFLSDVNEFYTKTNYKPVWLNGLNNYPLNALLNELKFSSSKGLKEKDYQYDFIESYRKGTVEIKTANDSLEAEIRFADAAIHFYSDISYGTLMPDFRYFKLDYTLQCKNVPALLAENISSGSVPIFFTKSNTTLPEIAAIENKLGWINTVLNEDDFREVTIKSVKINSTNKPLLTKLFQLGILTSESENIPDSLLILKIKDAQRQFDLLPDGVLHNTLLKELNIPLLIRWKHLNLAINYYRWLSCLTKNQSVINVNIPAAYMKVYKNNKVILEMRMIVGKISTPTPTLASTVDEVILYPYWHVPFSIATKELLPAIKRNPGYINAGNYQVLNREGKIMDPYSINWHSLSTSYFPYTIRQSTGCDNALGLLKLNFYNPFGVYLHDTPGKNLFKTHKRFYSHGCMRMQNPMALGHLVLKNNPGAIDTLEQKGCLRNKSPIYVHADEHMPVIVWYNPVGIDAEGRVIFYKDVYKKIR